MKRGDGGVTLIEIAVVMAIVGIMALFLAPALGEWLENFRIRQAAREVSTDFQFAKMKAISMGRYCTVLFNITVSGTHYDYIVFPDYNNDLDLDDADIDLDDDGTPESNETTDIFKRVIINAAFRNVAIDTSKTGGGITFTSNRIAFNRQGFPFNRFGGSIYLKNDKNNKGRQVIVSSSGRIKIEEY